MLFIISLNKNNMKISLFTLLMLSSFLTFSQKNESIGVLILAHGGSEEWNMLVKQAIDPIKYDYYTEIAFGMANPYTMQKAISKLEDLGVKKIVVVQLFISSFSFIPRQNEYLLGLRESMSQPPIVMSHGVHSTMDHSNHRVKEDPWKHPSESFPMLSFSSEIILTDPLNDHTLVAEILLENANKISIDKSKEILLLVGHGPMKEEDNTQWVLRMESLASRIQSSLPNKERFKMVYSITVRDDADVEIYNQAKEQLRMLVRQSSVNNRVLVVPLLLSTGGIEQGIIDRIEGLDYSLSKQALLPNPKINEFILVSVSEALSR